MSANLELAYPLHWPAGIPRTQWARRAAFQIDSFSRARTTVLHECRLLGAQYVVISSNVPTRQDGLPYADYREPLDQGVAVYFDLKGAQRCISCDRWNKVKDNLLAVARTIEAMRGIARWGSTDMMERAFSAFQALPPGPSDWRTVLGFDRNPRPTLDTVRERYRARAREAHPDLGGNEHEMIRLNLAMEAAEKELSR